MLSHYWDDNCLLHCYCFYYIHDNLKLMYSTLPGNSPSHSTIRLSGVEHMKNSYRYIHAGTCADCTLGAVWAGRARQGLETSPFDIAKFRPKGMKAAGPRTRSSSKQ